MEFFNSAFLQFLAAVLTVLAVLPRGSQRRLFLALASCALYAWWDVRHIGLLFLIGGVDWVAAARIHQRPGQARGWLLLSLSVNVFLLAYFKSLGPGLVPVGLSFYTMKSMSYTIDVYRGRLEPWRSWTDYLLFVSFFPELVAGPIVRASVFRPQLARSPGPTRERLWAGANIFLQGLTKKVVLAGHLAEFADPVFAHPELFCASTCRLAPVACLAQIYCDFSGYSDMAIGTAMMLGYDLPMNFNLPFASTSVTRFWRRWHITLGRWVRDYPYRALGGGRGRNLLLVTLLIGLWHGVSWTYVLFGLVHGIALIVESNWRWPRPPVGLRWVLTTAFLVFSVIPYRCPDLATMVVLLTRLSGVSPHGQWIEPHWTILCLSLLGLGHLSYRRLDPFCRFGLGRISTPLAGTYLGVVRLDGFTAFLLTVWLGLILFFCTVGTGHFVYFQL